MNRHSFPMIGRVGVFGGARDCDGRDDLSAHELQTGLRPSGPFSEMQISAARDIRLVISAALGARSRGGPLR